MLLRVLALGLRSSFTVPLVLNGRTTSRCCLLQVLKTPANRSSFQYTTKIPASNQTTKQNRPVSGTNNEISNEEMHVLSQEPDTFGTLSSFETQNKPQHLNDESKDPNATEQTVEVKKSLNEYEALLKDLIANGNAKKAVEIFVTEILRKNRMHPSVRLYNWLLDECLRLREVEKAFNIFDLMTGRKLKVSFAMCENLIVGFETSNLSLKKLMSLRNMMSKWDYKPNANMYNAMVRTYVRSPQWQVGLTLAKEMKEHGFIYTLDTINALLDCCSRDKDNGFYHLIELWHEIQRLDYVPTVHTFEAIFKGIKNCEVNNVDRLRETVERIRVTCKPTRNQHSINDGRPNLLHVPPNIGYLVAMETVTKPEDRLLILGGISNIIALLNKYDIIPSLDTVTKLLEIAPNTFVAHQKVIGLLRKDHLAPDANLFHLLLTKNCLRQNFENAQEIIDMMYASDVEVDLVTHGLLSLTCKNKDEAETFFDEFASKNIRIDTDILNAMLKNACASKDNDFVICVLRKMKETNVEPTEDSIQLVQDYHNVAFKKLRSTRMVTKKMRNESFKLSRECKQWIKHFRNDEPKDDYSEPKNEKNDSEKLAKTKSQSI